MAQMGMFDLEDRLKRLDELGDQLAALDDAVDFEMFRPKLKQAVAYSDGSKGGRPPLDVVMMFKVLVIQALNGDLSDDRMEFLITDRLSFMRFLGLSLGDTAPDAKSIWLFRQRLVEAGAIDDLFRRFDDHLRIQGYTARCGQIVDASLIRAPIQRNTREDNATIKAGDIPEDWQDKPNKLAQKDTDARWADRNKGAVFGYKDHTSIDKKHGFIRGWKVTDAARHDGAILREEGLLDTTNTGGNVWADTAYRSAENEAFLEAHNYKSQITRKKPRGKPMPENIKRGNRTKSRTRALVEHVYAHQKCRFKLTIRSIGKARATFRIGMANLAYNMDRLVFKRRRRQPSCA